jgi:hypothetical protein
MDDIAEGSLIALSLGQVGLKRQWCVAHARNTPLPPYGQAFIELCHVWFPRLMADKSTAGVPSA